MPFSILDLVVIGVVLISALLAAVRGFTREVLAIVAWVAAAAVAWYLHPTALPLAQQYISSNTVALVATIGGIFVITLIVVSIITVQISDLILDSRIGALDRTLGLFFGAARGFLICVIGWAFMSWLLQGKNPEWANASRTKSAMEDTRDNIIAMLPENAEALLQRLKDRGAAPEVEPAEPAEPDPQRGTLPTPGAPAAPAAPQPPQRRG
jgi:membrane protein required for colicin V production